MGGILATVASLILSISLIQLANGYIGTLIGIRLAAAHVEPDPRNGVCNLHGRDLRDVRRRAIHAQPYGPDRFRSVRARRDPVLRRPHDGVHDAGRPTGACPGLPPESR